MTNDIVRIVGWMIGALVVGSAAGWLLGRADAAAGAQPGLAVLAVVALWLLGLAIAWLCTGSRRRLAPVIVGLVGWLTAVVVLGVSAAPFWAALGRGAGWLAASAVFYVVGVLVGWAPGTRRRERLGIR